MQTSREGKAAHAHYNFYRNNSCISDSFSWFLSPKVQASGLIFSW